MQTPSVSPAGPEAGPVDTQRVDERDRARLTEGAVGGALFRLGGPMVFGMAAISLFNTIDTYFVAQLGTLELSAMSFTFPVVALLGSIALGLAVAATALVSQAVGTGDVGRVRRLTTDALLLALLIVGAVAGVGVLTIEPVFRLMGATDEVLPLVKEYMTIWYAGSVFVVVPMVANGAIRARGDAWTPAIIMMVAGGINAIVDPILIFGWGPFPRLELTGAALATVVARATTLVVALWVLGKREKMIVFGRPRWAELKESWRALLHVGIPSAGANAVTPLTAAMLTWLVAEHGKTAVAAFGVGTRIEMLALMIPIAASAGLSPFAGQNWGAGFVDRVCRALVLSQRFAFVYSAVVYIPVAFGAAAIAGVFTDDPEVTIAVTAYLVIVFLGHGFHGVVMVSSSAFNATGKPIKAAILAFLRTAGLGFPLAWLGDLWFGVVGIFAALPIANVLSATLAHFWTRYLHCPRQTARNRSSDQYRRPEVRS